VQRFFINDVGQNAREEVNEGGIGRNYGWNLREGQCPQTQHPPCPGPPASLTDPITDYPVGSAPRAYITAGAFIPNGSWGAAYDGGYLFADAGTGRIYLRRANGTVDTRTRSRPMSGRVADMVFKREATAMVLYYTVAYQHAVRRIVGPPLPPLPPPPVADPPPSTTPPSPPSPPSPPTPPAPPLRRRRRRL
jgi:hypothetical protein